MCRYFIQLMLRSRKYFTQIIFKLFVDIFTYPNIQYQFFLLFSFLKQSTDTSYFMANFFDCSLSDLEGIELIYSRIILTLALLICQIIIIQSGSQLLEFLTSYRHRSRIISITVLNLYIQNYASFITQFFSILAIRKISQVSYIQGDVSLLYGSNNHYKWMYKFILPGLTLIGLILPLSLFIFLYKKKKQLNCLKYKRHFGYLYNEYTQKKYFWEWIRLWKKTIIIMILINFETQILLKASLLGFCLQIYQFFTEKLKPYLLKSFNSLDLQSSQLCSCAIFLAAIKYTNDYSNSYKFLIYNNFRLQLDNYSISSILQMIIILICLTMSYPFVSVILQAYYKRFKPNILEFLIAFIQCYRPNSKSIKYFKNQLTLLRYRFMDAFCYRKKIKLDKILLNQNWQLNINNRIQTTSQILNPLVILKKILISLIFDQNQKKKFDFNLQLYRLFYEINCIKESQYSKLIIVAVNSE